jgi:multicomponent Na+:H+ antiporter subunit E
MKLLRVAIGFFFFYVMEVILANLQVAYDALTPTHLMKPAFLAVPLDPSLNDFQIYLLSNLITMTPGTLSVDVSADRRILYLHAMYVKDADALKEKFLGDYQKRIMELSI